MSELKTSTEEILVHLIEPDVRTREYRLSSGATLADLLRVSETSIVNQTVFVDGLGAEDPMPLRDGAVVTIIPRPRNAMGSEPWRSAIPAFRDEALFQEYSNAIMTNRDEVYPDED